MRKLFTAVYTACLLVACADRGPTIMGQTSQLGSERNEVYASQYGVMCDGTTDDTAAIQALIDASRSAGGIGRTLVFPFGRCVVSGTLMIRGVAGTEVDGQGVSVTTFEWRGDAVSPMWRLDRTYRVTLRDFSIEPNPAYPLQTGVRIERGLGCPADPLPHCVQYASSGATVEDIAFLGENVLQNGVHVAVHDINDDTKNDHHRFSRLHLQAYTGSAFVLEGRNAKALVLSGNTCVGMASTGPQQGESIGDSCVNTKTIPGHGAAFYWFGGSAMGNTEADFDLGDRNDAVVISGVYSEKSARALRVVDALDDNRMEYPVTLEAYRFGTGHGRLAADGEAVVFKSAGPLTIIGSRLGSRLPANGYANSPALRVRFEPAPTQDTTFSFIGNFLIGNNTDKFPARQPSLMSSNVIVP